MVSPTSATQPLSREKADRQEQAIASAMSAISLFKDASGGDQVQASLLAIVALLQRMVKARLNYRYWHVTTIQVVTVDSPVQGPDERIPDGVEVSIRLRPQSGATVTGYLASSRSNTLDSSHRIALSEGDAIELEISNLKAIWVNADTANAIFELIYEHPDS